MKRITRDIDPVHNRDLLERAPHACISFGDYEQKTPRKIPVIALKKPIGEPAPGKGNLCSQF